MCKFTTSHATSERCSSRMSNAEFFGFFKKAAKLTKDPCNGCYIVQSQRHFALSPRYLGRLKKGAMEILESEIGRYSESLRGVPLAYSNLQLQQQTGTILDDEPFIHFNVCFKAVVFQPSIGSLLKCVVNELAEDHVSCLVHNWFNLSLPLRAADVEGRLPKGSKVTAKVTKIQAKNGILAIQATPTGDRFSDLPTTDSAELMPMKVELQGEEQSSSFHARDKKPHDSGFASDFDGSTELPHESRLEEVEGETTHKKKKKKKKKKEGKDEKDGGMENVHVGEIVVKEEPDWERTADEGVSFESSLQNSLDEPSNEGGKRKKKKKKRKYDKESHDLEGHVKIKKEDSEINVESDGQKKEVKNEDKERLTGLEISVAESNLEDSNGTSVRVKEERIESDSFLGMEEQNEKRVKKEKHRHKIDEAHIGHESDTDFKKQKHKKRKHSSVSGAVNGAEKGEERTTLEEMHGTVGDDVGASPKKKKKKKKHTKEEIM